MFQLGSRALMQARRLRSSQYSPFNLPS